jgi:uncharacterized Zn finger protein (UPF0148 family)
MYKIRSRNFYLQNPSNTISCIECRCPKFLIFSYTLTLLCPAKQSKAKQSKAKQSKAKQSKAKQNKILLISHPNG